MNLHIEIQKIQQKYSANPITAQCMKDCFSVLGEVTEEIDKLAKKITANRSAKRKEAVKPTTTPLSPTLQLILQAPKELQPDLHAIRTIMLNKSADEILESIFDRTTPDEERDTTGQCLDELAECHVEALRIKFPDILPRDLNRILYQLAILSLTDGATIAVNAVLKQPKP